MKKAGKGSIEIFTFIILITGIVQLISFKLYAQQSDSSQTSKFRINNGYKFSNLQYSGTGTTTSYNNFIRSIADYRFSLAKNLSIQADNFGAFHSSANGRFMQGGSMMDSAAQNMNPGNFRRGDFGLRGVRLDIQHFTLGASYNYGGLNNLWRSGGDLPQNSKNTGLSLHAGLTF